MSKENEKLNFNSLIKILRNEKTLKALENMIEYIKLNIENIIQNKIITFKQLDELFFFLLNNTISTSIQIDFFKYFIDLFTSMIFKSEDVLKLNFLSNIFSIKSLFYIQSSSINSLNDLFDKYYNYYFPIEEYEYKEKEIIDYLYDDDNNYIWTQGEIISMNGNQIKISLLYDNKIILLKKNSYKIKPKNTFSEEGEIEWRENLKKDDSIDCLDIGNNWMKSCVVRRLKKSIIVCFQYDNIEDKNSYGYDYKYNKTFNIYNPKIRKFNSQSFEIRCFEMYPKSPFHNINFNENNMHIPFKNNNYIIPYNEDKIYSMEFIHICNYFISKIIDNNTINENTPLEYIVMSIEYIYLFFKNLSVHFMKDYIPNNLIPSFIKILNKFSLDKNKQFSKVEIDKLFNRIREIMFLAYYDFDIDPIIGPFEIEFGYNCFKFNDIFEKKLLGLNIISNSLKYNSKNEISNDKTVKISHFLLNDEEGDIIDLLFNDMNIHVELLKKGEDIFKSLFKLNLIDQRDIDKIYNYILSNKNNNKDILNSLYSILEENSEEMSYKLLISIINKITSITYEQLTEQDIILLTNITSKTNSYTTFKKIANEVLEYLYNYLILKESENTYSYMINFCSVIQNAKELPIMTYLYITYANKLTEDLYNDETNINLLVKFLANLFTSIDDKFHKDICYKLSYEIFTKNKGSYKFIERIIDYCKTSLNTNNNFNIEILQSVMIIINISEFKGLINKNRIIEFFNIFVFDNKNKQYQDEFLNWINELHKKQFIDIYPTIEELFYKLQDFCLNEENKDLIDESLIKYFYNLFIDLNTKDTNIEKKLNPIKYTHFNIIWNIIINFSMSSLIDNLISNFKLRNFTPEERYKIWDELIQYCFKYLDLKNENNIKGTLEVILSLIYYSEFYGTGNVISHESESIKKIGINIKIQNLFYNNPKSDLDLIGKLYNNSTIYDLKKEISKELNIPLILLSLNINSNKIENKLNGNLLYSIINNNEEINKFNIFTISKNKEIFDSIEKYPLTENKSLLSDRANAVFTEIFYQYSDKGFIDKDIFRQYIQNATLDINNSERYINEIFHNYDRDKDDKLSFKEYIRYYIDLINENENVCWNHIFNFDYRFDLQKCDSLIDKDSNIYYIENEKTNFMPRSFLSNNKNYFDKIFDLMNHENLIISEKAYQIIQMIETNKDIYDNILKCNFEDLIKENNVNVKNYSYQILLSILEKNEDENKELINNFINDSLELLINDFLNYYDKNFSNSFIQFVSVCIKIIYNCIVKIINDENFFSYLQNNNENEEEKEIKKYELQFNEKQEDILIKLSLNNILLNIFLILQNLSHNEKAYNELKDIIRILVRLITIILFIDIEDEIKIFEEYLNNILSLNKEDFDICNFFSFSNKLILNQISEDKKKDLVKFEEKIRKEILNKELMSKMKNIKFLFSFYENIITIGLKSNKKELNNILNNFIEVLLNIENIPSEEILCDYLKIIKDILSIFKRDNVKIKNFENEKILKFLINNYLINDFILDKEKNFINYQSKEYNKTLFEIIRILISLNPEINLKIFFSETKIKNIKKYLSFIKESEKNYNPNLESKSKKGYLGIHNLCSICYMISVIQQFFMIPLFKKVILTTEVNCENEDNVLFQLQKMFYYLNYSDRKFYSPESFVYSFKDYDGNPTNINIQCDAQEFLLRFMDQIENLLKNTKYKYLINSIFVGISSTNLKCNNSNCENVNTRKEKIYDISLDISNCFNLKDCLNKYIGEENIEDYKCDKCKNKITHVKNTLLEYLPNILIIHLQRNKFNYETFQLEKINSRIEFETKINIKNYTIDKNNKNKNDENYEYNLIGVIVHSGTAQYGHYYSFINSKIKNENPWIKFNDMDVTENINLNFEKDMFGGIKKINNNNDEYGCSAYMLIYEKKIKNIVFIEVLKNDKFNNENIEEFENEKSVIENVKKIDKEGKIVFIKETNEYVKLVNYEDAIDYIDKENENLNVPFIDEIQEDNFKFGNDKKIFSQNFNDLIENILLEIKEILNNDLSKIKEINEYINIINSFIFSILAKSFFKSNLEKIINILIELYNISPIFLSSFIENYLEPNKEIIINSFLFVQDKELGISINNYISKSLCLSIEKEINIEKSYNIINYFLSFIPVELSKKWNCMFYYNLLLLNLIKGSETLKEYFFDNNLISKCIDFILGEESPIYKEDNRTSMKNIKGKFEPLIEIISILFEFSKNKKLSDIDIKCIKCDKFYKKVIDNNYNNYFLGKLIFLIDENKSNINLDKDFINNILRYIAEKKINNISSINEAIESLNLIFEILNIDNSTDVNARIKNEILLGIPIMNFEQNKFCNKFVSIINNEIETILQKISTLFSSNKEFIIISKIFFKLLLQSEGVFNYLNLLPSLYNFNNNFIQFFIDRTENIIEKTKILKENIEDENVINAKEVIELIKKSKEKYSLINEKIISQKMFTIFEHPIFVDEIDNSIKIYKSEIHYIPEELKYQFNLNEINYYLKKCSPTKNTTRNIAEYDKIKNKEICKSLIRYFFISNIDCEVIITYPPFIDYEMNYSLKKNKIIEMLILDSVLDKTNINDDNLNIEKILLYNYEDNKYDNNNNKDVDMEKCVINCNFCGKLNEISENSEMKCKFCSSDFF